MHLSAVDARSALDLNDALALKHLILGNQNSAFGARRIRYLRERGKRGFWSRRATRQRAEIFLHIQIKTGELADHRQEPSSALPKSSQFSSHNLLRNQG